nr:hypothetical protein [Tanacetum cinerariifolium]
MKSLGDRGMAVDSLECLTQTHTRETAMFVALTSVMVETQAGIHEKEGHVANGFIYMGTSSSTTLFWVSASTRSADRVGVALRGTPGRLETRIG